MGTTVTGRVLDAFGQPAARAEERTERWVRAWAARKLCDQGDFEPTVWLDDGLRVAHREEGWPEEREACRIKAELIKGSTSKTSAYTAALEVEDSSSNRSIHHWALEHLAEIPGKDVNDVLERFVVRLEGCEDPMDQAVQRTAVEILLDRGVDEDRLAAGGLSRETIRRAKYRL